MTQQLIMAQGGVSGSSVTHLRWLLGRAGVLGARHIVLPFVDASSLGSPGEMEALIPLLRTVLPAAEQARVELHLETDLAPDALVAVMARLAHPLLRCNYDMGNSAALGHDPVEELTAIRPWLGSVHVKDRTLGGGSVPLGRGAVDFRTCSRLFSEAGFRGPWILQAAREEGVSETVLAIGNRQFVEAHLMPRLIEAARG